MFGGKEVVAVMMMPTAAYSHDDALNKDFLSDANCTDAEER